MEPLFKNHLTVDKSVLMEWYKKEFYTGNPFFVVLHIGLVMVYSLLTALVLVNRWLLPGWLAAGAAALFALLAVLVLVDLPVRYRLQVRALLKEESGRPSRRICMVFYRDFAMAAGENPGQDPAGGILACASRAAALQLEFKDVMQHLNGRSGDEAEMERLRPRLALLKQEMEALSAEVEGMDGRQHHYGDLTGYLQTQNLHILHFGEVTVPAAKNGFSLGDDAAFSDFIAEKLAQAASAPRDKKAGRELKRALRKYFPAASGKAAQ